MVLNQGGDGGPPPSEGGSAAVDGRRTASARAALFAVLSLLGVSTYSCQRGLVHVRYAEVQDVGIISLCWSFSGGEPACQLGLVEKLGPRRSYADDLGGSGSGGE